MGKEVQQAIDDLRKHYSMQRGLMQEVAMQRKYPLTAEPAMVHPVNSSVVKIRDNGSIDLFVGTDNGLRIDPEQKSIMSMSNVYKEKNSYAWMHAERNRTVNVGHDYVLNVENDEVHNIKHEWTIHAGDRVNVVSDGQIYMEAREKIHMKSPHIHLDATMPADELDPIRPPMGLMFEEDTPYGLKVPFGYQAHIGAQSYEKKPMYRREEFDDLHGDAYESKPSLRGADKVRMDVDSEWKGPGLRKRYENGKVEITGAKYVDVETVEKDGEINIRSTGDLKMRGRDNVDLHGGAIDIDGSSVRMHPMPPHSHPEYAGGGY